jgi:SnoaL-like domain
MNSVDHGNDPALAALLHDYIDLYRRDALDRWRELFLPEFVALSTNPDGSVTTWTLDDFFERQRKSFATGKPISEVLENVATERVGRLVHVRADFVWTDGDVRRRGALMLLIVERHGELRIQSLAFSYVA